MADLRAAVVGVGHLGKEHARVYAKLPGVSLVAVADVDEKQARRVAKKWKSEPTTDYRDLFGRVDAVSVVTPTRYHFDVASEFVRQGVAVLVEKPMTRTLDEAERLAQLVEQHDAILQVGHIERFNPAVVAIQKHPIRPRFIECHRLSPFAFRSADIGVVPDLMIHDLDIILHLVDSPVTRIDAAGVCVLSRHEDVANVRIEFESGCVANVTASRVSVKKLRKIRIFSEDSYISLDYGERRAVIYRKSPELTAESIDVEKLDVSTIADLKGFLFGDLLNVERVKMDDFEPLSREIEDFVECVRERRPPLVSAVEGARAIRLVAQIQGAIDERLAATDLPVPDRDA